VGFDAAARSTKRGAADAATEPSGARSAEAPDGPIQIDPTEDEIREWAERERKRREAWLNGPSAEERAAFARRERERRLAELPEEPEANEAGHWRSPRRYRRETQLVAEGAMSLLWRWSRRGLAELVRAGREWEEESAQSTTRRRVPLDDEVR
jgi:hypothetical protein